MEVFFEDYQQEQEKSVLAELLKPVLEPVIEKLQPEIRKGVKESVPEMIKALAPYLFLFVSASFLGIAYAYHLGKKKGASRS